MEESDPEECSYSLSDNENLVAQKKKRDEAEKRSGKIVINNIYPTDRVDVICSNDNLLLRLPSIIFCKIKSVL